MIDILIPVLGRPHRVAPLVQNIHAATSVPHRIWFLVNEDDEPEIRAVQEAYERDRVSGVVAAWGEHEYPSKINGAYRYSDHATPDLYPFVFNASDDLEFTTGWDHAAIAVMDLGVNVVATNDNANSQVKKGLFGTHCLVRRLYLDEIGGSLDGPGYFLHEGYDHNFVDRELCHLAQHRGVYAYAKNSVVKHHHPLHDSHVQMDATYRKGLRNFHHDQQLFFQRAAQWDYQGLSPQERRVARNQLAKAKR